MPIYLATAGEYSDYRVLRAFTYRTHAELFAWRRNTEHTVYGYQVEVEEIPLDEEDLPLNQAPVFTVYWSYNPYMYVSNESNEAVREQWDDEPEPEGGIVVDEWVAKDERSFGVTVKSADLERARKVMSERRAKLMALHLGL
jgi:hypothetical protein